jgi:nondiscriminating glutamyl-tRNA synthetase
MTTPIRTRFAPSPTGSLHLGGARTALFSYLLAKHSNGTFILRIEDTDQARSTEQSLRSQLEDLQWLGLQWDEGPNPKTLQSEGSCGPYRQSERLDIYKKYATELLEKDLAYYCFLSDEEIATQKEENIAQKKVQKIVSPYRQMDPKESTAKLAAGEKATLRFKAPLKSKDYPFTDLVRGKITLPSHMVGDFVLLRSDGMPVYNFCCVIDDHLMEISHALRGEEHLSNTLKQLMIYESFQWQHPKFAHLSVILGENRKKLSKRDAAVSCQDFREQGFLAQGILNAIALLGWTHPAGKEIFSNDELVKSFSTKGLNAAGAIFDLPKLRWINTQQLKNLSLSELQQAIEPLLSANNFDISKYDSAWFSQAVEALRPNMNTLMDAIPAFQLLDDANFKIHPEAQEVLDWPSSKSVIQVWLASLQEHADSQLDEQAFKSILDKIKVECAAKGKALFMPIRVAIIGQAEGMELKVLIPLLSCNQLIFRARKTLSAIEKK